MSESKLKLELSSEAIAAAIAHIPEYETGSAREAKDALRAALAAHRQTDWERRLGLPWVAQDASRTRLAVVSCSDGVFTNLCSGSYVPDADLNSRARVMATAPRALRALERLVRWGESVYRSYPEFAEARAVLAEAGVPVRGER